MCEVEGEGDMRIGKRKAGALREEAPVSDRWYRPLIPVAAAALVLVGACSQESAKPAAGSPESPAVSAEESPSPVGPQLAAENVTLAAGTTYRARALGGLTFEIDDKLAGNHVHIAEPTIIGIHRPGARDGIFIREVSQVHDPATGKKAPAPDDLVAWLKTHPKLNVRSVGGFRILGSRGVMLETSLKKSLPQSFGCPMYYESVSCYLVFSSESFPFYLRNRELARVIIFRWKGKTYSAEAYAPDGTRKVATAWEPFFRSLRVEGSAVATHGLNRKTGPPSPNLR